MAWYSGDAGDALAAAADINWKANGRMFSTLDSDNDIYTAGPCAVRYGWWYGACTTNNINRDKNGIWVTGRTVEWNVQFSRMLVKRN